MLEACLLTSYDAPSMFRLAYRIGDFRSYGRPFAIRKLSRSVSEDFTGFWPEQDSFAGVEALLARSVPVRGEIPDLSSEGGVLRYVFDRHPRHFAHLTSSMDGYLARFSSKSRNTLMRKRRKFAEAGDGRIDFRVYRTPEEIAEFHALAVPLALRTYQERLLGSGLPANVAYLEGMRNRAARGDARGYLLFLKGAPIAYLYTPVEDGIAIYAYLGYDPSHAGLSPGTVLQLLVFEDLFADPAAILFDFTAGEGQHKRQFATHTVPSANILYFRRGPRAWMRARGHWAVEKSGEAVGLALERMGVKARIKKLLRHA